MGSAISYNYDLTTTDINISARAHEKLQELFVDVGEDMEAIRIFVSGGGCSGMSYGMTFSDSKTAFDSVLTADGYKVYVDAVALNYMRGVEIDFVERSLGEESFVFNNVFAATGGSGACGGCGSAS